MASVRSNAARVRTPVSSKIERLETRVLLSAALLHTSKVLHGPTHLVKLVGHAYRAVAPHLSGRPNTSSNRVKPKHKQTPPIIVDPAYAASYSVADTDAPAIAYSGPTLPNTPATTSTIEGFNFDTQASTSGYYTVPPDNSAAAGPTQVVNVINYAIQWFTKAGTLQHTARLGYNGSTSSGSFFAPLNPTTTTFDPKVVYDTYNSRFVVVSLESVDNGTAAQNVSRILIAVSQTSDPNAGWYYTAVNSNLNISGHSSWVDYPSLAIDANAIYVTGNLFATQSDSTPGAFEGSRMVIVSKSGLYTGSAPASEVFYDPSTASGVGFELFTLQPSIMYGTTPGSTGVFLVSSGLTGGSEDYLSVIRVDNPLASPTFTNTYVDLGAIIDGASAFPSSVPEKGTSNVLDGGDSRTYSAVWRNNTLWAVDDINPTTAYDATNHGQLTAHWYKINTSNVAALSLSDQGDVGGEDVGVGDYTFYPSIAVDSSGNMGIDFSVSGNSTYPSAAYTVHAISDAASTVESSVVFAAGTDYYYRAFGGSRNRWGDYSALSIDPAGTSFWAYNQYAIARGTVFGSYPTEDGRFGTRYASFSVSTTGSISGTLFQDNNADGTLNGTDAGLSGQTVYLDVNNNGVLDAGDIRTTTGSGGTYTFSNVASGTYTLREVVPTGFVQDSPASSYSVVVNSGANVTGYSFGNFPIAYTGTAGNDTYTVQLVGSTFQLTTGTATYSAPFSLLSSSTLSISLLGGDDVLNVNGSGGNPVPTNGISYDGGTQTTADLLNVLGSTSNYAFTASSAQVTFGGNPINFTNTEIVNIDPKTGTDSLVVSSGVVHLPGQTASGILADHFSTLNISGGSLVVNNASSGLRSDKSVLIVNSLSLNSAGKLDLNSNDAIIHGAASYTTIFGLLSAGYANGAWNGLGIDSSAANADPQHGTAVGSKVNTTGANFDGQTGLLTTDILLKYTYYGDANLDGVVDASDYSLIDSGYTSHQTGWQNGNFNYDSAVDGSDYTLIDNNFNRQGGAL